MIQPHFAYLEQFLRQLPAIATPGQLAAAIAAVSTAFGLPTVMACAILVRGDKINSHFYFGNASVDVKGHVESIFANGALLHEARRRISPFTWNELWAEEELTDGLHKLIEIGQQQGWHDGFVVPIHGPSGYVALVCFAGKKLELDTSGRAILQALAHVAHQCGRALYTKSTTNHQIKLTPRELQVMRWVSRGKTDSEIAAILKLSATTVHSYVEQAKHKLGVRSRSQAVSELSLRELLIRSDI
ncbi:MAG: LuxR C-terminal-related transcriptional regulator [Steroidobacteraceae bacterium]